MEALVRHGSTKRVIAVGEYVGRIYSSTKDSPPFIVEDIERGAVQ